MPLTRQLLHRFRSFFGRMNRIVALVLFVVVGWWIGLFALIVTAVADGVGMVAGGRLSGTIRLGIGVVALVLLVLIGGAGGQPTPSVAAGASPALSIPAVTPAPSVTPSPSPSPSPTASPVPSATAAPLPTLAVGFAVLEPTNGSIVSTSDLTIRGTAPAGSTIVRDIPLQPDDHAVAGPDGTWQMAAQLQQGQNTLTLRLGDDRSTTVTLLVDYEPPAGTPIPAPTPNGVVGKAITVGDWVVTVNSVTQVNSTNEFIAPDQGNLFWVLDVTMNNQSGAAAGVGSGWQLQDSQGFIHDAEVLDDVKTPELSGTVASGATIRGYLTFQMAKSAKPTLILFQPDWLADQVRIAVK